eukprot:4153191-Amphidinium_carterae.1
MPRTWTHYLTDMTRHPSNAKPFASFPLDVTERVSYPNDYEMSKALARRKAHCCKRLPVRVT